GTNMNDQPWIRTGPSDHVYVTFNDDGRKGPAGDGKTASVLVSTEGGLDPTAVTLDKVGTELKDAPSVRLAVNGNTVYAAFLRWTSVFDSDADGSRFNSQLVVVRSDNGGEDSFTALGAAGDGVQVATPIDAFSAPKTYNTPLTLGQERTGNELAIAVDPNNSNHVLVVYDNAPGATR